jgi:hypothetical protein
VRRIAIGDFTVASDDKPSPGSLLLAGVVGASQLPPEQLDEIEVMLDHLGRGKTIGQPQMRHRLQVDTVGLDSSHHRLLGVDNRRQLFVDPKGYEQPLPQVLVSCYAIGRLDDGRRWGCAELLRRSLRWDGADNDQLMAWLAGNHEWTTRGTSISEQQWALEVFGFDLDDAPSRTEILRRFRQLVRDAHPDAGGENDVVASNRITELTEARRVLASNS